MSRVAIALLLASTACAAHQPGTFVDPHGDGWATYSQGAVRTSAQGSSINYYAFGYIPISFVVADVPRTVPVYPGRGSLEVADDAPTCREARTVAECPLTIENR